MVATPQPVDDGSVVVQKAINSKPMVDDEITEILKDGKFETDEGDTLISWFNTLTREFGWQMLTMLFCAQHITKGFVTAFVGAPWPYIMKAYGVPAPQMAIYMGVTRLPWALKPAIGILSDAVPICGFSKLPYLIVSCMIGITSLACLATMGSTLTVVSFVMLIFCVSMYASTTDLLSEAVYARVLRSKPTYGPSLLSFVWGGMIVTGMLATLLSGSMLATGSPWNIYGAATGPAAIILLPVCMNWLKDPRLSDADIATQQDRLRQQGEAVVLAFVMMAATLTLTWSGMTLGTKANAALSAVVALVVLFAFSISLNPIIAKVNAFSLIQTCLSVSLGGAGFYFMMDTPEQYPEGPHFSVQFYNIVLPLAGSLFTLIGIWFYNRNAARWSYQKMYVIGNLVVTTTYMFDIVFYNRWNKHVGINDHIFVLGSSSIQSVVMEWLWMPSVVLLSQLCPKGMEAIMYANLAGCHNLGDSISNAFAALMLEMLEIQPNGSDNEGEQFKNLWVAALISCLLPLLPVALVPWFIPDKLSTERVLERENMPANEGSLLRRWWGLDREA